MPSEDIEHRFQYHPPQTQERQDAHAAVRQACCDLADWIDKLCPDGREKDLAIERIEEAMMWANASLARQG